MKSTGFRFALAAASVLMLVTSSSASALSLGINPGRGMPIPPDIRLPFLPGPGVPKEGGWARVGEIPVGRGTGRVAYQFGEEEPKGPDSFAVDAQGSVYILDGPEKSIEILNNGVPVRSIALPYASDPLDIALAPDGTIYVLDTGREPAAVYAVGKDGQKKMVHELAGGTEFREISGLNVDRQGKVWIRLGGSKQVLLTDAVSGRFQTFDGQMAPGGSAPLQITGTGSDIRLSSSTHQVSLHFRGLGGVQPLGVDSKGALHVEAVEMVKGASAAGEVTLRQFSPEGEQLGVVLLDGKEWTYVPKTRFTVLGLDGSTYALIPLKDRVRVVRAFYGRSYRSNFDQLQAQATQELASAAIQPAISPLAVYRPAVTENLALWRVWDIITRDWWFGSYSRTPWNSTMRPPDWLATAPDGYKKGIPYTWGGFDSYWTSSSPSEWANFGDAMNKGKYAGNVLLSGWYKDGTAGLDCSGFVSAVWGLSEKVGTWAIKYDRSLTQVISSQELQPMDAAVSNSHVVLVTMTHSSGIGTAESTTVNQDKTQYYWRTWSYLSQSGYVYRRYVNMSH